MRTSRLGGPRTATPVYAAVPEPGVPPVAVMRVDRDAVARIGRHGHDFPTFTYAERGGGSFRFAGGEWPVEDGDLLVIAPGDVIEGGTGPAVEAGWGVFFTPDALGPDVPPAVAWRAHPLLAAFARGTAPGPVRLRVPPPDRARWVERLSALDAELRERRPGHRDAVRALLVLLLVDLARLSRAAAGFRGEDDALLASVFGVVERRYREPISLRDVASAVGLSPGHLTTTVRVRTGRTVQEWITERRLAEARRLLTGTDLAMAEIARTVGYASAGYFARVFRRAHGVPPRDWRRAGRDEPQA